MRLSGGACPEQGGGGWTQGLPVGVVPGDGLLGKEGLPRETVKAAVATLRGAERLRQCPSEKSVLAQWREWCYDFQVGWKRAFRTPLCVNRKLEYTAPKAFTLSSADDSPETAHGPVPPQVCGQIEPLPSHLPFGPTCHPYACGDLDESIFNRD